jgi:hypothetical protein
MSKNDRRRGFRRACVAVKNMQVRSADSAESRFDLYLVLSGGTDWDIGYPYVAFTVKNSRFHKALRIILSL